jgi:hypothetical protein
MSSRLELLRKSESQIESNIANGQWYDAVRLISTISNRYYSFNRPTDATRVAFHYTKMIFDQHSSAQQSVPLNTLLELIDNFSQLISRLPIPQLDADIIVQYYHTLFNLLVDQLPPSHPTVPLYTGDKYPPINSKLIAPHLTLINDTTKFIQNTITQIQHTITTLSIADSPPTPTDEINPSLQNEEIIKNKQLLQSINNAAKEANFSFANFFMKYNMFEQANHFYLQSQHPIAHVEALAPILLTLPTTEIGSAILRFVCLYLIQPAKYPLTITKSQTIANAQLFFKTSLKHFPKRSQPLTSYLSFAEHLILTAKISNIHIYALVVKVYHELMVSSSDSEAVAKLVLQIGDLYCDVSNRIANSKITTPPPSFPNHAGLNLPPMFNNMLSSLFGAMNNPPR